MLTQKEETLNSILNTMKAQFGSAVKYFWVYDGDLCPCCFTNEIDELTYSGHKSISINAFMYRERGVLIAYLMCGECAKEIIAKSKDGPTKKHQSIEKNLIEAYHNYLNSLDA